MTFWFSSGFVLMLPQPFLTPVPPIGLEVLAKLVLPFGYVIGLFRTVLVLALGLTYVALALGVCLALVSIMLDPKSANTHGTRLLCHHYTD